MSNKLGHQKFPLGSVVMTAAVSLSLIDHGFLNNLLDRHLCGDWGDLDEEDLETNEDALKNGGRLFSSYDISEGSESKIWIITEHDRSVTTLLFPSDY